MCQLLPYHVPTAALSYQLPTYPANCRPIMWQLPPYPANYRPILTTTTLSSQNQTYQVKKSYFAEM
jgi:hypothetical protein